MKKIIPSFGVAFYQFELELTQLNLTL